MDLQGKCLWSDVHKFGGRVREWLWIELIVFTTFMVTMFFFMLKSRCMKVGIDNSD